MAVVVIKTRCIQVIGVNATEVAGKRCGDESREEAEEEGGEGLRTKGSMCCGVEVLLWAGTVVCRWQG